MGTIWYREFLGGLDTRRMPETTEPGVLIQAKNGHINRGGEFESRAAFVEVYDLPAGTVGLAAKRDGLVVFGSDADPGVPVGVNFQQIEHPDSEALVDIPSFDLFSGSIYNVGVFADGSRHHFYQGTRVEDWFDGRARAAFRVTGGKNSEDVAATGSFNVTGGTLGSGNEISDVKVDGVTITSGAEAHTGNNETTATAVAANITAHTSTPNYTATAVGPTVVIEAAAAGSGENGNIVAVTVGGDATVGDIEDMGGGADSVTSVLSAVRVAGVNIMLTEIDWETSNSDTADAITDAINNSISNPNYEALAVDDQVVILAEAAGMDGNGKVVTFETSNDFQVSPSTDLEMEGGADIGDDTFLPGSFVRTIGAKMYSLSGPNMHFSGVGIPTGWTTDNDGAGFIDLSTHQSGAEQLQAIANYQTSIAIFSEDIVQVWFVDPDPELNRPQQPLRNTGTTAPRSVVEFGDSDIFYLHESGIRSLRARDSSNAPSTTDIGVAIDSLVTEKLFALDSDERMKIFGLIEPREGRYWLIIKDTVFVLSYFRGRDTVSAWSTYELDFEVEEAVVWNKRVYVRSGNKIYAYGGLGDALTYDDTEAVVQSPYLDAERPTQSKQITGVDVAAQGEWKIYVAMNPNNLEAQDKIGVFYNVVADTTFDHGRIPVNGSTTHVSLIFKSQGTGPHKLGSFVIHHDLEDNED